jgi:hypothetical protein
VGKPLRRDAARRQASGEFARLRRCSAERDQSGAFAATVHRHRDLALRFEFGFKDRNALVQAANVGFDLAQLCFDAFDAGFEVTEPAVNSFETDANCSR